MEFKKVKLKEIATIQMGQSPKGSSYNDKNIGMPFLQGNRTFGRIYPTIDTWTTEPSKIANKKSILMSVRAPVGDLNIANEDICIGRGLCSIEMLNGNNQYLYYLLKNSINEIKVKSTGTVFDSINRKELEDIEVLDFNEIQQNKIIDILFCIDKKIELNNKINDNLYKYMENLHKEWFVKYSIFKDCSFKNSELGMIPDECEVADIYSISNIIYGAPFKSSLFNDEKKGKPIIRIRDLKNQEFKTYTEEIHPKGYLLKYGDIAVGMDGEFKPYIWGNDEAWLNQRICVFDNKRKKGKAFLYYSLKPLLEYVESTETATTVIHIGKNDFDKFRIVLPSSNILNRFDELTNPMIEQIVNNIKENNSLIKLRDTLLPKLMNGEIDLDKIEI